MFLVDWKKLRSCMSAGVMAMAAVAAFVSASPAFAQSRGLPDFTDLVEQVGPSVVNIRTLEKVSSRATGNGSAADEEMLEFFRRFGVPIPNLPKQAPKPNNRAQPQDEEQQPRGVGSGFILTTDGYVMTNAHVVDGADEVLVTLTDKREFKARIIGADKRSDVAVVKIEATGLPAVKVGDVSRLRVGEWVMAIGSPFGLENTVTAGGFMGISFSIPMDEAVRVSDQLRASGRVSRGRIGVQIDQVTKEVAESIGLGKPQGALVRGVETGSPAEKAGVEAGDIITKFDGKPIEKSSDLPRMVGRRGATKDLSVTIAEIEPEKPVKKAAVPEEKPKQSPAAQALGLTVSELNDAQKKELKIKGGVKVEAATEGAARAGVREGDVIVAIANMEVASVKEFDAAVAKIDKSKPVNVLFRRGEWAQYALIRPAR